MKAKWLLVPKLGSSTSRTCWPRPAKAIVRELKAVGYRYVAGQRPDGRSLVWSSNSISTTHHMGLLALDYESFAPVAQVLVEQPVVAVRGDAKWRTLGELMADGKARPEGIAVGNSGVEYARVPRRLHQRGVGRFASIPCDG